jgi:arsenate reductase
VKKVYCLSSCDTCRKIIKEAKLKEKGFEFQDIKTDQITPRQLDEMKKRIGSYEALFSRRAIKYKSMGLKDKKLGENDFRNLILLDYTFLKRPVIIAGPKIFCGSETKFPH